MENISHNMIHANFLTDRQRECGESLQSHCGQPHLQYFWLTLVLIEQNSREEHKNIAII